MRLSKSVIQYSALNIAMETILLLAHTEPDGSLAKPALEALGAAKTLNAALARLEAGRRAGRPNRSARRRPHRRLSAHEIFLA